MSCQGMGQIIWARVASHGKLGGHLRYPHGSPRSLLAASSGRSDEQQPRMKLAALLLSCLTARLPDLSIVVGRLKDCGVHTEPRLPRTKDGHHRTIRRPSQFLHGLSITSRRAQEHTHLFHLPYLGGSGTIELFPNHVAFCKVIQWWIHPA